MHRSTPATDMMIYDLYGVTREEIVEFRKQLERMPTIGLFKSDTVTKLC